MIDLDKLRADAETARQYAQHHGVKIWTEHIFAALALADAALARIAKVQALYQPYTKGTVRYGSYVLCDGCGAEWPCDTKRALTEGENE